MTQRASSRHVSAPKGFTLIELLAVIVFMGIFSQLVMANIYRGQQAQQLRQASQDLVQDIRTAQTYAVGGQKVSICKGSYSVICPATDCNTLKNNPAYPDLALDNSGNTICGEVPKGGYGIEIQSPTAYNLYPDTYVKTTDNPTTGQCRWYNSCGSYTDAALLKSVTLQTPVQIWAFEYNNDSLICTPGSLSHKEAYVTFEPPFGIGHIVRFDTQTKSGKQDVTIQSLKIWLTLGGDTSRCRKVSVNGITGQVTEDIDTCPPTTNSSCSSASI